jgi:DNA-binding GntR family transcriptional regulator
VTRSLQETNQEFLHSSRLDPPDPNTLFELDTRFHHTCVQAGAGARLLALHDAIKPQAERYIRLYISVLTQQIGTSVAEHQVIIDAIDGGDPSGAQMAVRGNWRNAAQRLARVIRSVGERGSW